MTPREILVKAKQAIIDFGWTQGEWQDDRGCMCMSGAIDYAIGGSATGDYVADSATHSAGWHADEAVRKVIQQREGHRSIIGFNDSCLRTKEQVLDMFDVAIEAVPA